MIKKKTLRSILFSIGILFGIGWSFGFASAADFTPAQCLNVIPGATGLCYDKFGPGHCDSTQRDMGQCTTADDHCCVNLATVPGITKAQCDAKPGYPSNGGCLDPKDDWGVRITDLGASDWACCKYSAGNPGLCPSQGGQCKNACLATETPRATADCIAPSGLCCVPPPPSGSLLCTDPSVNGTCNTPACPSGTQQTNLGTCPNSGLCCIKAAAGGSPLCTDPSVKGTCNPVCPSGTQQTNLGTCPNSGLCCISPASGPPANVQAVTFSNLLKYETVNDLLGSVLIWLQGIVATLALIFIVIGGFLYITSGGDTGRVETAKKCITAAVIGFALAIAGPSFLKEIGTILGWGPAAVNLPPGVGTQLTVLEILTKAMNFLLSVVGIIAIIMLVVGGFMYLTAAGDEDQIDRAKALVKYSVIGIFVALAALVIVTQVAKFFA